MNSWFKKAWPFLTLGVAVVALLGGFLYISWVRTYPRDQAVQ